MAGRAWETHVYSRPNMFVKGCLSAGSFEKCYSFVIFRGSAVALLTLVLAVMSLMLAVILLEAGPQGVRRTPFPLSQSILDPPAFLSIGDTGPLFHDESQCNCV